MPNYLIVLLNNLKTYFIAKIKFCVWLQANMKCVFCLLCFYLYICKVKFEQMITVNKLLKILMLFLVTIIESFSVF